MNIIEILNNNKGQRHFSFELLPPLKGNGTDSLFRSIDKLKSYNPLFINITTHDSEYIYKEREDGLIERQRIRRRPGTVAIAATIQQKYNIPVIPHVICSGATKSDIEYELLDLQFLGIKTLMLLRGDKAKEDKQFTPVKGGYAHSTELIKQVNDFNKGLFIDGTEMKHPGTTFDYAVACYPEKHEEAANIELDLQYLKAKQDLGAKFAITQLFYDNQKFYDFVKRARNMGITIPIIPGIKPFAKLSQLTVVPKTFHCDIPKELSDRALLCHTDEEAKALGVEWAVKQVEDLYNHGFMNVHFYTVSAVQSVQEVVSRIL